MPKAPPPKVEGLQPFWKSAKGEATLYHGHVVDVLNRLPPKIVQTVVTSPPYWGLRDYGTAQWIGGDPTCDHVAKSKPPTVGSSSTLGFPSDGGSRRIGEENSYHKAYTQQFKDVCGKCGAKRVDLQIGSEPSPDCGTHGQAQCGGCFVCSMVAVFRGVQRVLRDDGTVWLNLGDTYGGGNCGGEGVFAKGRTDGNSGSGGNERTRAAREMMKTRGDASTFRIPSGNLLMIPFRIALALQADGWVLRQDIVWSKPSPMPESVANRCTKSHEYVFLLTKRMGYYYDAEAIKEQGNLKPAIRDKHGEGYQADYPNGDRFSKGERVYGETGSRNKRSVWTIASESYSGAHYAVFPTKLVEPCILAGTSAHGCCATCGTPYERVTSKKQLKRERPNDYVKRTGADGTGNSCANTVAGVDVKTLGWEPGCKCVGAAVRPCIVLDPFVGSGTTCAVAVELGRHGIGIDLSAKYLQENAVPRIESSIYNALDRRFIKRGKGGKWFKKSLG